MRWTWIGVVVALFAPVQAAASSCFPPQPLPGPPSDTPAGVWEYRQATSVALVSVRKGPQPPCFWIKFRRLIEAPLKLAADKRAYPSDTCETYAQSRRYQLTVIEALKGNPPSQFPALLGGKYPVDADWMRDHRPDWLRAGETPRGEFELVGGYGWNHQAFNFCPTGEIIGMRMSSHRLLLAT